MMVQIGDVVELDRLSGGRYGPGKYVVAEITGAPSPVDHFVKLVRKSPEGGYAAYVRSIRNLTPADIEPFEVGEKVRVNAIPETGTFLSVENGVARVLMPAWSKALVGSSSLSIEPSVARVSYWSLVLENRT